MIKAFAVCFTVDELRDLRVVLDRAMNTWEPHLQPPWLQTLSDELDRRMAELGVER